jgi:hypothetical protein
MEVALVWMNPLLSEAPAASTGFSTFPVICLYKRISRFALICIARAMRLAYELSAWTDSFCNAHKSVMEAFLMLDEKTGDTFG